MKAKNQKPFGRRQFIRQIGAAGLSAAVITNPVLVWGTQTNSKIKLGLIGCGGRGTWIAGLFLKHGGYELTALADYFPERTESAAEKLELAGADRFHGLSAYKRLLESGVDAVAIESPPYFHPEQAAAAVEAGKHVYLAKPVAVDVPGCMQIQKSGQRAGVNR